MAKTASLKAKENGFFFLGELANFLILMTLFSYNLGQFLGYLGIRCIRGGFFCLRKHVTISCAKVLKLLKTSFNKLVAFPKRNIQYNKARHISLISGLRKIKKFLSYSWSSLFEQTDNNIIGSSSLSREYGYSYA